MQRDVLVPVPARELRDGDFDYLGQLALETAGLRLAPSGRSGAGARLLRYAADGLLPTADLPALVDRLRRTPVGELHQLAVEAVTINETSFFRDPPLWAALRSTVLPELIAARAPTRQLALWSAACATGQEPYSLVMELADHLSLQEWVVRLVASDLSRDALDRGRRGCYSRFEIGRGLSPERLTRWFDRTGESWTARSELRRAVDFRRVNLVATWPVLPVFDVVLLRNVLIYFDAPTKLKVLDRVRRLLHPDGCLVLGGGETFVGLDGGWHVQRVEGATLARPR